MNPAIVLSIKYKIQYISISTNHKLKHWYDIYNRGYAVRVPADDKTLSYYILNIGHIPTHIVVV